ELPGSVLRGVLLHERCDRRPEWCRRAGAADLVLAAAVQAHDVARGGVGRSAHVGLLPPAVREPVLDTGPGLPARPGVEPGQAAPGGAARAGVLPGLLVEVAAAAGHRQKRPA